MQCVWRTPDPEEAGIIAAFLSSHGVKAWAFDQGMIRLDWFHAFALGGCRIMTSTEDAGRARELVSDWRASRFDDAEAWADQRCPHCSSAGAPDPLPRRLAFAFVLAFELGAPGMVIVMLTDERALLWALMVALAWPLVAVPAIASRLLARRMRCIACGHRWRTTPESFAEANRKVAAASASGLPSP